MALHIAGVIRVASVLDNFVGPGQTEGAVRHIIGALPTPAGKFGPARWDIFEDRTYSHDPQWGYVTLRGTLHDCEPETVREWWASIINGFTNHPYLSLIQGVIGVVPDGGTAWTMDHHQVYQETAEIMAQNERSCHQRQSSWTRLFFTVFYNVSAMCTMRCEFAIKRSSTTYEPSLH